MHDEQQNKNADIKAMYYRFTTLQLLDSGVTDAKVWLTNSFVMLRNCSFPTTKNTETNVAHILNKNKTNKHHYLYYQNEKFYSI